jgi:hypothetical protein
MYGGNLFINTTEDEPSVLTMIIFVSLNNTAVDRSFVQ